MEAWMRAVAGAAALFAGLAGGGAAAQESGARLAADKGCYNCHGQPPRRSVPSFQQLVADYAKYRGQPSAEQELVQRLHHGSLFSHIAAHESLSGDEAAVLVHWLVLGGK